MNKLDLGIADIAADREQCKLLTAADCDELLGEFKARLAELDAEPASMPSPSSAVQAKNSHHGRRGEAWRGIPGAAYFQGVRVLASHP